MFKSKVLRDRAWDKARKLLSEQQHYIADHLKVNRWIELRTIGYVRLNNFFDWFYMRRLRFNDAVGKHLKWLSGILTKMMDNHLDALFMLFEARRGNNKILIKFMEAYKAHHRFWFKLGCGYGEFVKKITRFQMEEFK